MAMAAPLVHAEEMTTEKLLEQATQKGYTKQGEMFSGEKESKDTHSVYRERKNAVLRQSIFILQNENGGDCV